MSSDNFCKQHSTVLLYFVAGFLLSINVISDLKVTSVNEYLETARFVFYPSKYVPTIALCTPKEFQCQLIS